MDHGELPPKKKKKKTKRKAVAFARAGRAPGTPQARLAEEEEIGWGAFCDSLRSSNRPGPWRSSAGRGPFAVQKATLPVALSGRDCLVRARGRARARRPVTRYRSWQRLFAATRRPRRDQRCAWRWTSPLGSSRRANWWRSARRQAVELAAYCRESSHCMCCITQGFGYSFRFLSAQESRGDIVCATPAAARTPCFARNETPPRKLGSTCVFT